MVQQRESHMRFFSFAFVAGASLLFALCLPGFVSAEELKEIDWLDLMPAEDLYLLENMPALEHQGDGPVTLPDEIMTGRVVPEMDGKSGRIPGFVVPLKTTEDMRILEFFLVPYYGACIHVPPPPPNQIIHVKYKKGFRLEALYDPVWIEERWKLIERKTMSLHRLTRLSRQTSRPMNRNPTIESLSPRAVPDYSLSVKLGLDGVIRVLP